jgi:hypothetical protein
MYSATAIKALPSFYFCSSRAIPVGARTSYVAFSLCGRYGGTRGLGVL